MATYWLVCFFVTSSVIKTFACNVKVKIPPPGVLPDQTDNDCTRRNFGYDSFVCVCDASHCDLVPEPPSNLKKDGVFVVVTDRDHFRLASVETTTTTELNDVDLVLTIDAKVEKQRIDGFGGAFTDAAGINIASLSTKTQDLLMRSYFGPGSAEYSIGRIPMGGTDFSTRCYSYLDTPEDFTLTSFQLAQEDVLYKVPFVQRANALTQRPIKYFGSPWSAPIWMKTNGAWKGYGRLKGDHNGPFYKTWAKYFLRFLEEYDKRNISFWGLTAQNEPEDGYIPFFPFNCMGFTARQTRDFIVHNLGPELKASGYKDVKLMTLDDNRFRIWDWVNTLFDNGKDEEALKYVDGTGIHWYWNWLKPASILTKVHDKYPNKFILATEACEGATFHKVKLGDWSRGENYAHSIIEDLQNWVTGWTDWNLALDLRGGPNWANNFVDASIIVDVEKDTFYKQPMFYAMAHFSKFIPPGSRVISVSPEDKSWVESVAVNTPNGKRALVIHNRSSSPRSIRIVDPIFNDQKSGEERFVYVQAPAKSILTLTWLADR